MLPHKQRRDNWINTIRKGDMVKRSLVILLSLWMCFLWVQDSHAQATTTTPSPTVARPARLVTTATSLFPQGIYFQLQADFSPDQTVESLGLVIQPINQSPTRLSIPLEGNVEVSQSEGLIFANVIWDVTDTPPPYLRA